jgi:hypothetical protein
MRWTISWAPFWSGDCADRLVGQSDTALNTFLGRAYQWLMARSFIVQGDGPGPWKFPTP